MAENTKEMFNDGLLDVTKIDITEKFKTKEMGAIKITREEKCSWVRVLNAVLYKDNKVYRHIINKADIGH